MPSIAAMNALDHAVAIFGSQDKLAQALGIRSPSISEWRRRRIPVGRCRDIVAVTNGAVSLSDLRPDIWPASDAEHRDAA